jgi:hypothetical protein
MKKRNATRRDPRAGQECKIYEFQGDVSSNLPVLREVEDSALEQVRTPAQERLRALLLRILKLPSRNFPTGGRFELFEEVSLVYDLCVARPDFLELSTGLVIEVDGGIHNSESKMKRDNASEINIYAPLGLTVLRISNEQIFNLRHSLFLRKVLSGAFQHKLPGPERDALRKRISYHRKQFEKHRPFSLQLHFDLPSNSAQKTKGRSGNRMKRPRHLNGYKSIIIKPPFRRKKSTLLALPLVISDA